MKTENFFTTPSYNSNSVRSLAQLKQHLNGQELLNTPLSLLTSDRFRRPRNSDAFSDKDSVCSGYSAARSKRNRTRMIPMRSSKGITKKSKTMDYTNYAYNEAVGRLKLMLAESYATPNKSSSYLRSYNEDAADNYSDNMSAIERPVLTDISRYLSPSQKSRVGTYRSKKPFSSTFSSSKENLMAPTQYQSTATTTAPFDYYVTPKPPLPAADSVQAPVEIFNFIEKQEDYIEQLEKESKYCRNELTNLLGKVKDVISENEQLTETARSELATLGGMEKHAISPSSESDEINVYASKKPSTPRKKESGPKSPRYASAPNIVYEARISELEAELMQANIDLKRVKLENEDLKRKLSHSDPLAVVPYGSGMNCETHRKQIEHLQLDKAALEETIRQLHKSLDDAKAQQYNVSSKRYVNDLMQMERSQSELEVKHLRDELDRQHERVRELQHEMARRIADERANAERRYNNQVDQLGGDLSSQWEQVAKLQLEVEREKRYETDLKRDVASRNAQIEELKMELRSNRSTFLADMAQANAEKQSLEQDITALRMHLDRAARDAKTEASRLNAEINSLRQRLDRGDADLLHSKREVLRLNDDIANLEKELAYGELKNEIRPTKKDLDKRISEMQEKHAETVNELEEMIQSQKQLMDKLTTECKMLTNKLEDTTLKHNKEKQSLREMNEKLMERLKQIWASYKELHGQRDEARRLSLQRDPANSAYRASDIESCGEEHFSNRPSSSLQIKPLSTTSRPHMAQPTPHAPLWIAIPSHHPTATIPYSVNQQQQTPTAPQHQRPQPPYPPMISATNPSMTPQATSHPLTTTPSTIMASTTMMMKISRTILEREKKNGNNSNNNNSNNNNNNNNNNNSVSNSSNNKRPANLTQLVAPQPHQQAFFQSPPTTTAKITPPVIHKQATQTWPPQSPQMTTIQTTAPTRAMTSSNMTRAHTMPHMISSMTAVSSNMGALSNMIQLDKVTAQAPHKAATATTQPQTIIRPHISTTLQQRVQALCRPPLHRLSVSQETTKLGHHQHHRDHYRQQHQPQSQLQLQLQSLQQHQHQQQPHHHQHHHHQHFSQQQPRHHLPLESPRSLLAAQQQRAAHNRERAVALWGQELQLEQSAAENPLCHNSLPRQQPKSSCSMLEANTFEMLDPFELEFSISSPSLMRSCDSDTYTELADDDFESISNMSISPPRTAIQKPPQPSTTTTTIPTTTTSGKCAGIGDAETNR